MAPKPGLTKYARTDGKIQVEDEEVTFLIKAYRGVIKRRNVDIQQEQSTTIALVQ